MFAQIQGTAPNSPERTPIHNLLSKKRNYALFIAIERSVDIEDMVLVSEYGVDKNEGITY